MVLRNGAQMWGQLTAERTLKRRTALPHWMPHSAPSRLNPRVTASEIPATPAASPRAIDSVSPASWLFLLAPAQRPFPAGAATAQRLNSAPQTPATPPSALIRSPLL